MALEDAVYRSIRKKQKEEQEKLLEAQRKRQQTNQTQQLEFFKESQGNLGQTILGTAGDAGLSIVRGAAGISEGLADWLTYGLASLAAATGNPETAKEIRKNTQKNVVADIWLGDATKAAEQNSVIGRTSRGILEGVGQVGLLAATGGAAGAAGLSAGATTAITSGAMGLSGAGHGMTEAYQGGATDKEAAIYGLASGAVDTITEALFGGLGKASKALGFSKGALGLDDKLAQALTGRIKSKLAKNLIQAGVKATGEGLEEALAYAGQTVAKKLTYMSDNELGELWNNQELLENFVVGTMTGAIMQGGDVVKDTKAGRDLVSGLSDSEQTVLDKVYKARVAEQEKGGKKLSTKEKGQIYDAVVRAMDRGYIAVEDIEAALGGDTYKRYQEMAKAQEAVQKEFDQLNAMKNGDMTGVQTDRREQLRQQIVQYRQEDAAGKLKRQYQEAVEKLASTGKLAESYRERGRRSERFTADLSQYDEKQRATVQRAMDSGILNNTNKTHDFVDLIAKVAGDKGIDFNFTDNQKLRESGFALDGVTVNGFVDQNGVTINTNSAKALNSVAGHEITHVLEGTELYDSLREAVFAYAESKGELRKRRSDLEKLYTKIEHADIDAELTADLVGDYIFTDADFVRQLHAGNRNLFQKVWGEIKYMLKLATAGSKEARQLEKAKKLFEDVYGEGKTQKNTTQEGGVRYSLNENAKTELHKALYDTGYTSEVLLRDETPAIMLAQKGVQNLPMVMNASHIRENVFTATEAKKLGLRVDKNINYHGLGEEFFLKVIDGLDNVKEAYRGTKNATNPARRENYFLLVSEFNDGNGNIVNVPVYIDEKAIYNRAFIDVNKISTVFGKENFRDYIQRQIRNGDIVRIKNRSSRFSESDAPIAPHYETDASMVSISDPDPNVNQKMSLSAEGDIAPVRGGIYGKDIRIQAPTAEDLERMERQRMQQRADQKPVRPRVEAPVAAGTVRQDSDEDLPWTTESAAWLDEEYRKQASIRDIEPDAATEEAQGQSEAVSQRKALHNQIMGYIRAEMGKRGFELDAILDKAKNLSTFTTVDSTPQRVMERAFGYEAGQALADLTVNQAAQHESQGIRWLNTYTDRKNGLLAQISKQYHIKPGSNESAAAQMYAEGFYVNEKNEIIRYGDAELAADFPNTKVQAQIKGLARDPRVRQAYDDALKAINEARSRNAYPEIPRLDNYFLHFRAMSDTFSRLGIPFNPNDIKAKDLPTDLNGVTADLKPGQPYFASQMQRKGKRTSFDLLGGMEQYLSSAKNQIYHIDDIQTIRALENYIVDTYGQAKGLENLDQMDPQEAAERIEQIYNIRHLSTFRRFLHEEANALAGKTALIDRGVEGFLGRRGVTFLDSVRKQVGTNMVGFNVSSALTNTLAIVQGFAKTNNKFDFVKAVAQTAQNRLKSITGKQTDGFSENSPVMIRRKGADRFYRTPWQQVTDAGMALMGGIDDIATELIARTKFNELTRKGMEPQKAHFETDKWTSRLMGDRSIGQMPQLFNSKTLGLFTQFQLETRNQLDSMFYDTIQEAKASSKDIENGLARNAAIAAKSAVVMIQLAVLQHWFGKAFEEVAGYNPTFDIIETLVKTMGWNDEEDSEDTVLDNLEQGFQNLLDDLPYVSTFTGGRIPIEAALPIKELLTGTDQYGNEISRWQTALEALPYYLLPTGYNQYKKTRDGLGMFYTDMEVAGSYTDAGKLRFAVEDTPLNRLQAAIFGQYANPNARAYFDQERTPLGPDHIEALNKVDMTMQEYWDYLDRIKGDDKTLADKIDVVVGLDLPLAQKNYLANNLTDRKDPIDLTGYDQFGNFEEFDFFHSNPDKYRFLKSQGISVKQFKAFDEDTKEAWNWAAQYQDSFAVSRAVTDDLMEYRGYSAALSGIKADKDEDGNSISGSRKKKVIAYIRSLNISDGAKMILFKSEYTSDDSYNREIINYINDLEELTYSDKKTILEKLGFKVGDDGRITW